MHAISCNMKLGSEQRNGLVAADSWPSPFSNSSYRRENKSVLVEITKHLEIIAARNWPAQTHKHTDTLPFHLRGVHTSWHITIYIILQTWSLFLEIFDQLSNQTSSVGCRAFKHSSHWTRWIHYQRNIWDSIIWMSPWDPPEKSRLLYV